MSEELRTELDGQDGSEQPGPEEPVDGLSAGQDGSGEDLDEGNDGGAASADAGVSDVLNGGPSADDGGDEEQGGSPASVPVAASAGGPVATSAPDAASEPEEPVHEMTFTEHLNELRVRLMRCMIGAFVGFLICYGFADQLFLMLMKPLVDLLAPTGGALIYTGLPEAFFTQLKVAAIAGLFVASPYIFYQLWMFIAPGLYEGERKYIIPIALFSAICFVAGALFGYYVVFPFGFQFFLGYATDFIKPMPSVKEYFSFSTSMLFAFGFIFELPLFMFFLSVMGIVTHRTLRKYRKFAILGSFIVAAILTPPDVVSQCLMAGPLCVLYEIGIWVAYVFGKKPKEPQVEEPDATEANG